MAERHITVIASGKYRRTVVHDGIADDPRVGHCRTAAPAFDGPKRLDSMCHPEEPFASFEKLRAEIRLETVADNVYAEFLRKSEQLEDLIPRQELRLVYHERHAASSR